MALVATENIVRTGLEAAYTAVAASQTITNDGSRTFIQIVNGVTAMVCTIVTPVTVDTLAVTDRTVSIGANEEHFIGPFPTRTYGATVTITFDDTTDGTIAVLKVPAE